MPHLRGRSYESIQASAPSQTALSPYRHRNRHRTVTATVTVTVQRPVTTGSEGRLSPKPGGLGFGEGVSLWQCRALSAQLTANHPSGTHTAPDTAEPRDLLSSSPVRRLSDPPRRARLIPLTPQNYCQLKHWEFAVRVGRKGSRAAILKPVNIRVSGKLFH